MRQAGIDTARPGLLGGRTTGKITQGAVSRFGSVGTNGSGAADEVLSTSSRAILAAEIRGSGTVANKGRILDGNRAAAFEILPEGRPASAPATSGSGTAARTGSPAARRETVRRAPPGHSRCLSPRAAGVARRSEMN